jgi:hypothetical protein
VESFLAEITPPKILIDLQQWMGKHISLPLKETGEWFLPVYEDAFIQQIHQFLAHGHNLKAEQMFGIYNQQYWIRFFTLAQLEFPTLFILFGAFDFIHQLVVPSLLKYPPDRRPLFEALRSLPRWIQEDYVGDDWELVLQIAMIDRIYHRLVYEEACLGKAYYIQTKGDLISFRNELLSQKNDYWLENPLPRIDFSKTYRFCFRQTKQGLQVDT